MKNNCVIYSLKKHHKKLMFSWNSFILLKMCLAWCNWSQKYLPIITLFLFSWLWITFSSNFVFVDYTSSIILIFNFYLNSFNAAFISMNWNVFFSFQFEIVCFNLWKFFRNLMANVNRNVSYISVFFIALIYLEIGNKEANKFFISIRNKPPVSFIRVCFDGSNFRLSK